LLFLILIWEKKEGKCMSRRRKRGGRLGFFDEEGTAGGEVIPWM